MKKILYFYLLITAFVGSLITTQVYGMDIPVVKDGYNLCTKDTPAWGTSCGIVLGVDEFNNPWNTPVIWTKNDCSTTYGFAVTDDMLPVYFPHGKEKPTKSCIFGN